MTKLPERFATLSPQKLALVLQNQAVNRALINADPIAIIGIGCRFPQGADTPERFWQLLRNGVDAVTEVPASRWNAEAFYDPDPDAPGKINTRYGSFLNQIDSFDPAFFGISPREARMMDPQQRLLLEVSWESLEHAGINPTSLRGSQTGVFIGMMAHDYAYLSTGAFEQIDAYTATGSMAGLAAGRLAYFLGSQGPTFTVDTTCSSSLVSAHLACQSLRTGECDLALAGGVQLMLAPDLTVMEARLHMFSADGRCKAFDQAADGMGRGEGCGVLVLKRFADAIADGDKILALIRSSAVNHDGRSSGLTVPNGVAQQRVMRQALAGSGINPEQVGYVEAHGTGTPVGDLIEVGALESVYGRNREGSLFVGSVKTNIGHTEGAAGVAALIKVALALQYGEIPPNLHFHQPNPQIPWQEYHIAIPTKCQPWPISERRIAAVSSFGLSGTNGHVVLEATPADLLVQPTEPKGERSNHLLTLSATSAKALRDLAQRYTDHLSTTDLSLADLCFTAYVGRAHFDHRSTIVANTQTDLCKKLTAIASGEIPAGTSVGQKAESNKKIAFLFTGQGSQYVKMGHELYQTQPTFRATLDRCEALFQQETGTSLLAVLYPEEETRRQGDKETAESKSQKPKAKIDETTYTQPALFALEVALATLWQTWGIQPDVLIGHSVGELAAACVAGVFSLEDGLKLVAARGRLMGALPQDGAMVSLLASEARVRQAIAPYPNAVAIAAVNGPASIVIAGQQEAVLAVADQLAGEGVKTRRLTVSHAFHSPLMEPILADFRRVAERITYQPPKLRLVSNLTGQLAGAEVTTPDYWVRHVRETVRFADGVAALHEQGVGLFLEIGPKPSLLGMAGEVNAQYQPPPAVSYLPSLREEHSDWQQMLGSLGACYVHGIEINWQGFDQDYHRRKVALPTYPFQRQSYWLELKNTPKENEPTASDSFATWLATLKVDEISQQLAHKAQGSSWAETIDQVLTTIQLKHKEQVVTRTIIDQLYEVAWRVQAPTISASPPTAGARWLLLADQQGVGAALARQLHAAAQEVTLVYLDTPATASTMPAERNHPTAAEVIVLTDLTTFRQHMQQLLGQADMGWRGIIHLWSLDGDSATLKSSDLLSIQQATCGTLLELCQVLQQNSTRPKGIQCWVATAGAQVVDELGNAVTVAPMQAAVWGMGRVISLEQPEIWGGLIDLDPAEPDTETAATALWQEICAADEEEQVAYRQAQRYVARLAPTRSAPAANPIKLQSEGLYLITGGLGALGLYTARWLAEQGARHLILMGRRGIYNQAQETGVADLQRMGVTVKVAQLDVTDEAGLVDLFAEIAQGAHPLRGIIHAAGVAGFAPLHSLAWADFAYILRPKVLGGWILHQLTKDLPLDFFLSYTSIAGIWGSKQQAHYAAANHALDGLMAYRRSLNLPGVSIAWGPWGGSAELPGMATPEAIALLQAMGVRTFSPQQGLAILSQVLKAQVGQITAADVQWSHLQALYTLTKPRRFLTEVVAAQTRPDAVAHQSAQQATTAKPVLVEELATLPPARRGERLQHALQQIVGQVLGLRELPACTMGFTNLGMDSLMALELRRHLERELAQALPATLAFEYPTVDALAAYLLTDVLRLATPTPHVQNSATQRLSTGLDEPIAVISMACRFPGADTPEAFWQLLCAGVDAVGEIPTIRWHSADYYDPQRPTPGKMYVREAAFIEHVDQFDPLFFGIAPREATGMDPMHRLLLEVSWEALERAGLAQQELVNSQTGVFVGIGPGEYGGLGGVQELANLDTHAATSGGHAVAAGRLAYTLGLQGPTLAVDTACSSSLVALHLACQSLRTGECDLALAGGVSLMLSPVGHVALSQMQALSTDGRCKTFAAAADGYGRGEGGGMVVLKRLSAAEADGDEILAVIKGSAVNHDGPSSGLTVPNKRAQEKLLRQALANAQVAPDAVSYIEAHGTGTPLGDPIEIRALSAVFGKERPQPLLVGSAKTNIGHLEAAAGIVGFVKTVLALQHGQLPPHLHFTTPNPYIEWDEFAIAVPTTLQPWPSEQRIAGVSAFGISGTNAHVILEAASPRPPRPNAQERSHHLLSLSAKSEAALDAMAANYATLLANGAESALADICYTTHIGRSHFAHRLSLVGDSAQRLQAQILAYLADKEGNGVLKGTLAPAHVVPKIAFLFAGQGSQYVGMGRELYESAPVFRAIIERCEPVFQAELGRSLIELLYPTTPPAHNDLMESHPCGQAANYAFECALADLWRFWGVQPTIVLGHSLGDFAAAYTAGVLALEDGLRLVTERGRLMEQARGTMVSVLATEAEVAPLLTGLTEITIGVINGPQSIVISGSHAAVTQVTEQLQAAGVKTRKLDIPVAAHSPMLDPVLDTFEAAVRKLKLAQPQLPVVSSMTGQLVSDELTDPAYWRRHLRNTVRFADGVQTLQAQGCVAFLEIGPKPTLLGLAEQVLDQVASDKAPSNRMNEDHPGTAAPDHPVMLPSLRENQSDWQQMLESLGALYVRGAAIDWQGFDQAYARRKVALPTYPFQRQRYWIDAPKQSQSATLRPFIDKMLKLPLHNETVFEAEFSVEKFPFLRDHVVFDAVISPGACQLVMALSAAELSMGKQFPLSLKDVVLPQALVLSEVNDNSAVRTVQVALYPTADPSDELAYEFKLISFAASDAQPPQAPAESTAPTTHATGYIVASAPREPEAVDLAALRQQCMQRVELADLYTTAAAAQMVLGPSFRWLVEAWRGQRDSAAVALARVVVPEVIGHTQGHLLHPGLLDACLQVAGLARQQDGEGAAMLPFAFATLDLHQPVRGDSWWCYAQQVEQHKWDLRLVDEKGSVLVAITGFEVRTASAASVRGQAAWRDWLYTVEWQARPSFGLASAALPTPSMLAPALREAAPLRWKEYGGDRQQALHSELDALSIDYVLAAFAKAGFNFQPGIVWSSEQIARQLGAIPSYHRLLEQLLRLLAEVGLLTLTQAGWRIMQTPTPIKPAERLAALQAQADATPELTLLTCCGERLLEVLRGVQEPLALLFPNGDATVVTKLYTETPGARLQRTLLQQVMQQLLTSLPLNAGLRILEIGASVNSVAADLLPFLPPGQTDYLLTDSDPSVLHKTQARFADYAFLRCQPLDLEQKLEGQNFGQVQADLIIAANRLHTTKALPETLAHIRQLLAPGGQLILLERTSPSRWLDLTFGLTEDWWRFADSRQAHPLLSTEQWQTLLCTSGFRCIETLEQDGQALILAQADSQFIVRQARTWLLFADTQGVAAALATHLEQQGETPILVYAAQSYHQVDAQTIQLCPDCAADYARLLTTFPQVHGLVHLWSLDTPPLQADTNLITAAHQSCGAVLQLAQALLQAHIEPAGLWLVTQNAQAVTASEPVNGVGQASLWGMGKALALEHPELNCVRVDLDGAIAPAVQAAHLFAELISPPLTGQREEQIVLRPTARYVAQLARFKPQATDALHCQPEATYLVTGGLAGLGLATAEWLATQGANHLLLMGRSQPSAAVQAQLAALRDRGVTVTVFQGDVTDRAQLQQMLWQIDDAHPLRGIIHSAGVLDDGALVHQNWARFAKVLAPKLQGAWHLHELTKEMPLDFFVLYSSAASLLGNRGQTNHAAANAFLDAFAHFRRAQGLPALALNWGAWADIGAAADLVRAHQTELAAHGQGVITPQQGVAALTELLVQPVAQIGVVPLNWHKFINTEQANSTFFALFNQEATRAQQASTALIPYTIRQQLEAAAVTERHTLLMGYLQQQVSKILRMPVLPNPQLGFNELGMDSLMTIELRRQLERGLAIALPSTIAFEYPTTAALATYILEHGLQLTTDNGHDKPAESLDTQAMDELEQLSDSDLLSVIGQAFADLA